MRLDNKEWKCRTIMEEILIETATELKPTFQGSPVYTITLCAYPVISDLRINS